MNTPATRAKAPSCDRGARCPAEAEGRDLLWTVGAVLVCAVFMAAVMWS